MEVLLREADRDPIASVAKKHSINEQIYKLRRKLGWSQANDVRAESVQESECAAEEDGGRAGLLDRREIHSIRKKTIT
jgi:hypothetical protein